MNTETDSHVVVEVVYLRRGQDLEAEGVDVEVFVGPGMSEDEAAEAVVDHLAPLEVAEAVVVVVVDQ